MCVLGPWPMATPFQFGGVSIGYRPTMSPALNVLIIVLLLIIYVILMFEKCHF